MTEISESPQALGAPGRAAETKMIGLVSGAHFASHVYFMVLPPLFAFIRADYGVSFAELGMLLALFNILSTVLQAPAGFLVDRFSPGTLLIGALALSGVGFLLGGLVPAYWTLVVGLAIAGIANTIYHPADYALLSSGVAIKRMGQAFSFHTFAGLLGTAVTPAAMLFLAALFGWHAALLGAGALGVAGAFILAQQRHALGDIHHKRQRAASADMAGWTLLLSWPILRNLLFFVFLSLVSTGVSSFTIVALVQLYDTPLATANLALTAFLMCNALGVLAGGPITSRTTRYDLVAAFGLITSAAALLIVAIVPLGAMLLALTLAAAGFLNGIFMPARDMLVRAVTPEGSFGKVFGFVTGGFSIGGIVAPLVFGWLMDLGEARWVFLLMVVFTLMTLPLVRQTRA